MLDGDNRIRLIIAGLVLTAIAVGYMIFSQRFSASNTNKSAQQITPTPAFTITPSPVPSTSEALGESTSNPSTTKGGLPNTGISSLPKTSFPTGLLAIFSASAVAFGWGLRKYPN